MVVSVRQHFKDAEAGIDMLDSALDRGSGIDQLKDQVIPAQTSPMDSILGNFGASPAAQQVDQPQQASALHQKFANAIRQEPVVKPTVKLDNNRVANNTQANRQEGQMKTDGAAQKMGEIRDLARQIDAQGQGMAQPSANDPAGAPGASGGMLGSMTGGLVRDAMLAGGLMAVGLPPVMATAVGAASMAAAITGRGTLGVANSGEFAISASVKKGRGAESGYARSEPASDAAAPAPQQASAMWNKLSKGPGFGPTAPRMPDAGSIDLAGASLEGITALKLAEDSPAMMAYSKQMLDGQAVLDIHKARVEKGIVADMPNILRAMDMGVPDAALSRPVLSGLTM